MAVRYRSPFHPLVPVSYRSLLPPVVWAARTRRSSGLAVHWSRHCDRCELSRDFPEKRFLDERGQTRTYATVVKTDPGAAGQGLEGTYKKIAYRLVPFLVFLFILAWVDRVNVGFAQLQMLADLDF